ncbi:MAG: hypothetical protein EXQ69_07590 [Acidimicrobiia bacterium]|nr:hypothetical protein [Acidimicrobiia bacterium]
MAASSGSCNHVGVDEKTAFGVLGIEPSVPWQEVRAAYLRLVRQHHPDRATDLADAGVRTITTVQLTEAFAVLAEAHAAASGVSVSPGVGGRVSATALVDADPDTRSVLLDASQDDAYAALFEVFHMVGVVSYVDRQSSVLETIVTPAPGQATSLLALLEPVGADRTEALLGVEPLGNFPPASIDVLVEEIARLLAVPRQPTTGGA